MFEISGCKDKGIRKFVFLINYTRSNMSSSFFRCLYQLSEMKTFSSCCPFSKEIRTDVILSIKKGVTDRFRRLVIRAGGEELDIKNRWEIQSVPINFSDLIYLATCTHPLRIFISQTRQVEREEINIVIDIPCVYWDLSLVPVNVRFRIKIKGLLLQIYYYSFW